MALPVGLAYDPAGRVCSTRIPVCSKPSGTCSPASPAPARPARWCSIQRAHGLLFPVRVRTGAHKGELAWMPLQHWRVLRTLHNPRYAGAFAYGRRRERPAPTARRPSRPCPASSGSR